MICEADDIAGVQSLYGSPVSAPVAIAPGERVSGHLPRTDAEVRYQVTLQNKLLVKLEGPLTRISTWMSATTIKSE